MTEGKNYVFIICLLIGRKLLGGGGDGIPPNKIFKLFNPKISHWRLEQGLINLIINLPLPYI